MAGENIGKITQVIGAVLDIRFDQGKLPKINEAIRIPTRDGGELTVEVSQHLGDDTVRCIAMGSTDGLVRGMGGGCHRRSYFCSRRGKNIGPYFQRAWTADR